MARRLRTCSVMNRARNAKSLEINGLTKVVSARAGQKAVVGQQGLPGDDRATGRG